VINCSCEVYLIQYYVINRSGEVYLIQYYVIKFVSDLWQNLIIALANYAIRN
jgi:hypothetical protein